MADRYDDMDRVRERYWDRDRGRDAGQRYEDYRRESRGEGGWYMNRESEPWNRERESGRESWRGEGSRDRESWRGNEGSRSGEGWRGSEGYGSERRYSDYESGRGESGRSSYDPNRRSESGSSDWRSERGRYAGVGPKNYQRSDERIREEVCERLTQHPDIDASEIEIQVRVGEVTLTGSVEDRHQKRTAEDIVEDLSGVRNVHNQLRISKGLGQRIGESLGMSSSRESEEHRTRQPELTGNRR